MLDPGRTALSGLSGQLQLAHVWGQLRQSEDHLTILDPRLDLGYARLLPNLPLQLATADHPESSAFATYLAHSERFDFRIPDAYGLPHGLDVLFPV